MYKQNELLGLELTIVVSLVITGFTPNVLTSIAEVSHLFTFVLSVLKLLISVVEGVCGSQSEPMHKSALHLWHTNHSNHSAESFEYPEPS
jgi:hypothetical protein